MPGLVKGAMAIKCQDLHDHGQNPVCKLLDNLVGEQGLQQWMIMIPDMPYIYQDIPYIPQQRKTKSFQTLLIIPLCG